MTQARTTLRRAATAFQTLVPYGKPYRRHLAAGGVATVVLVAARLAFPWPLRGLLEITFPKSAGNRGGAVLALVPASGDPLVWLVGSFAVIVLVWGVSEALQRWEFTRYATGLMRDVQKVALRRVPKAVKSGQSAGDLISTVTSDTALVKTGVKSILISMSRNGGFFLGVAFIVLLISPPIGSVFLAGGLATIGAGAVGAWRSSMVIRRSRLRQGELTDDLHQLLSGAADAGESVIKRSKRPDSKASRIEGVTTLVIHIILGASTCTILILTVRAGRAGSMTPGSVFTILAYILLMHNKTVSLGRAIVRLGRVLPSAERIARLAQRKTSSAPAEPKLARTLNREEPQGGRG
jgi:ABC-type multidrug transport system fused ATPase/permease subunit